ncbi:hypothetical protein CDD80_3838 [Ophiocordyceps camponoti-rufipedis]|uniref:Myb-like domain-containing protein n=1 Tax=Ophiocordyceps camponoti-rufipedis TaxID=2004952 RepID=A0A2C5Z067_9HYPO|nr:hypothetical protein CDD80_3838 [Ophiocordyceps camponoti-rufipedis]
MAHTDEPVLPEGINDFAADVDDFGPLEMFDSNVMSGQFSSQVPFSGQAPEAVMESAPQPGKKHKRHRQPSLELGEEDQQGRQHRKGKRRQRQSRHQVANEIPDSQMGHEQVHQPSSSGFDIPVQDQQQSSSGFDVARDQPLTPGYGVQHTPSWPDSRTKRKTYETSDIRRRKKRRANEREEEEPQPQPQQHFDDAQGAVLLASAAALLQSQNQMGLPLESAPVTDQAGMATEYQESSAVDHIRRPGQSGEETSWPVNSVSGDAANRMDVDLGSSQAVVGDHAAVDPAVAALAIAREAWAEQQQQQQQQNSQISLAASHDVEGDASQVSVAEASSQAPSTRRGRASRKKAKPTFFEQPPNEAAADEGEGIAHDNGEDAEYEDGQQQPADDEDGHKSRSRTKKTSKGKKSRKQKDTPGDEQAPVAEEGETRRARRNRLNGYKQGRFDDAELARIASAVESFRASNGMTQGEVNQLIHAAGGTTAGDKNAELWTRIFEQCPDRHRQKVINITRKKFHNFVARGTWTLEQEMELKELIGTHGTRWAKIAALINRHPEDLRDRYRNYLVCGEKQRKDAWDEVEEANLTQYVIKSMEAIDELRRTKSNDFLVKMTYEELIDWQNISELMGRTRSRLQCITKWKSLNIRTHGQDKLVSTEPHARISFRLEKARRQISAMPPEERLRLIQAILKTEAHKDAKIPWQRLVDRPFRNTWHRSTQMLLWRRLRQTIPGGDSMSTLDCALYLTQQLEQTQTLPDVDSIDYDDAQEMEFIMTIPVASPGVNSGTGGKDQGNSKSSQYVAESDVDEPDAEGDDADVDAEADADADDATGEEEQMDESAQRHEATQGGEMAGDVELQIDPALVSTLAPIPAPAAAAKKMAIARKTGSGKPPTRRAAPTAVMDPIEDVEDEEAGEEPEVGGGQVEEIEETPPPPATGEGKKKATRLRDAESSSDDDEDIPAVRKG